MSDDLNILDGSEENTFFFNQVGHIETVTAGATPVDIWEVQGLYPFPASALTTTIVSTSANDTAAGTGVRTVEVSGLDSNYLPISETIALNGTTAVTLSNSYLRIYSVIGKTFGSSGTNEGQVDVLHSGIDVIGQIFTSFGRSLMAIFTTPANWPTVKLLNVSGTIGKQSASFAEINFFIREFGSNGWIAPLIFDLQTDGYNYINDTSSLTVEIPPRTDMRMTVQQVATTGTGFSVAFAVGL